MPTSHGRVKPGSAGDRRPDPENKRRSQRGASAVEFAFIVPVLVMIVAGMAQFGAIFFLRNNMESAAEEAARALADGSIETQRQAGDLVERKLADWGVSFSVDAGVTVAGDPADVAVTVVVTTPLSEAAVFDYLGVFEGGTLSASASTRRMRRDS
ncbi:MAG: TadE family protein [Kiloniellales bacterium]|nr:TadE family protein [Kiloniellales bacterium]